MFYKVVAKMHYSLVISITTMFFFTSVAIFRYFEFVNKSIEEKYGLIILAIIFIYSALISAMSLMMKYEVEKKFSWEDKIKVVKQVVHDAKIYTAILVLLSMIVISVYFLHINNLPVMTILYIVSLLSLFTIGSAYVHRIYKRIQNEEIDETADRLRGIE
jgi:hypothetical protein